MKLGSRLPDHLQTRAKGKSNVPFSTDLTDRTIKGFLSVESLDSSGDIVKPENFKLEGYKQNPQVLFEHKYYMDENGNKTSIGKCLEICSVTIKDEGDPVYFSVYDDTGNKIDMFPRAKSFRLEDGTRAVWCALEITNDAIWAKIKKGELNALSWQGFSHVEKHGDYRVIKSVDLIEASITAIPDNRSSKFYIPTTFNVLKSLILDSSKFNKDQVFDFVEKYGLSEYGIFQTDKKWIISKSAILDEEITDEMAGLDLVLDQEENMENKDEEVKKEEKVEETVETTTTEKVEETTTEAEEVKVETPDSKIESITVETFEQFKSEIKKTFSGLETTVVELTKKVKDLSVENKKSTDIKEEQFTSILEEIKKSLKDVLDLKDTVKKSFIETERQETIDTDTRSEESKKNDVFNPFFGLKN